MDIRSVLQDLKDGKISVNQAESEIRYLPFVDLEYAMIDYHRELRNGCPEVIYCEGKTLEHTVGIFTNMKTNQIKNILATRANKETYTEVQKIYENAKYSDMARIITVETEPFPKNKGKILVLTAGTSDIPVAEEAALTAEFLGNHVERLFDVGVAGLHRLLSRLSSFKDANVMIVAAGMEGALASVVGGLTDKPVIALPTSVGYGASMGGLAALMAMLNSCASGVGVVNIDNGFGAGYLANSINRLVK